MTYKMAECFREMAIALFTIFAIAFQPKEVDTPFNTQKKYKGF